MNLLSAAAKQIYIEEHSKSTGIEKVLFNQIEESDEPTFSVDRYIQTPIEASYRRVNEETEAHAYQPGSNTIYTAPIMAIKVIVDEYLRDMAVCGAQDFESYDEKRYKRLLHIISQHYESMKIKKARAAIDVLKTGKLTVTAKDGKKIEELCIDFGRKSSNKKTFDAQQVPPIEMLASLCNILSEQGASKNQVIALAGHSFLQKLMLNEDYKELCSPVNPTARSYYLPERFKNSDIFQVSTITPPGSTFPVVMASYSPDFKNDFIAGNEIVMFSAQSKRYLARCGLDYIEDGQIKRGHGEMIFDSWIKEDPTAALFRSQAREVYIPANVNHTALATVSGL